MARNNITTAQLVTCLLSTVTGIAMMNGTPVLYRNFGQNSPLVVLIISVLTALLLWGVSVILGKTGFMEPYEAIRMVLGKIPGTIVYACICFYLLFLAILALKIFIYIINIYYLPKTPLLLTAILLIAPAVYATYGGIRVLGHLSSLIYLLIAIFISIFAITKNNYTFSHLFPLLNSGFKDSIIYIPWYFVTSGAILASFFLLPAIKDTRRVRMGLLIFSLLSFLLFIFVYAVARSYFGKSLVELILPFFNLSSRYGIGPLERLDVLFILIFIPVMGLYANFYFTLYYRSQCFLFFNSPLSRRKVPLALSALIIALAAAYLPLTPIMWQALYFTNIINLAIILVLFSLYLIFLVRKRRLTS